MQQPQRQKYLFIVNSGSGPDDNDGREEKIKAFLSGTDLSKTFYPLPQQFDIKQIKDHVLTVNPEIVVAVGGDGTVTMLAAIIANTDIALGILPAGSANGMAKELDIPINDDEALDIIANGIHKKSDLISINDKEICLHLSDIGLNAHLIKHFDEGKLRGKLGYAKVILKTLWLKEKMHVLISNGHERSMHTAFMVGLANASKYGTGAVINPEGKIDDGLFEVIIVKRLSFWALLKMLFNPGLFNPKHIEIFHTPAVEIKTTSKMHFQVDGEYMGKVKTIIAKIMAGAVTLILPAETSDTP
ncbi:MAG: diacylglycerol kinase family protein [Bacteroidota bacterium]